MARKRKKYMEGYANNGHGFISLPRDVTECANYAGLTHVAKCLITDAGDLYNGKNNGNLCLSMHFLEKRGWSESSLKRARKELLHYGFIVLTRRSKNRNGNLYALSWIKIDASDRHSAKPTANASAEYRVRKLKYRHPKRKPPLPTIQKDTVRTMITGEIPERFHPKEAVQ
jgi:hypothetical protein